MTLIKINSSVKRANDIGETSLTTTGSRALIQLTGNTMIIAPAFSFFETYDAPPTPTPTNPAWVFAG